MAKGLKNIFGSDPKLKPGAESIAVEQDAATPDESDNNGLHTRVVSKFKDQFSGLAKVLPKNGLDPNVVDQTNTDSLGLKYDEDGVPLTPSQQTVEAIITKGAGNYSWSEKAGQINRASLLDQEIQSDSKRLAALDNAIKMAEELDGKSTQYQTKQYTPELTVDDIESIGFDVDEAINAGDPDWNRKVAAYRKLVNASKIDMGTPAIERLGLHDYYPDITAPLQVGTYSGSIVGSNPIYVAGGGYLPIGIVDARKRALERAASDRAKKKKEIMGLIYAKGAIQYQDQIDDMSIDMLKKYGEATGWDFSKLTDFDNELSVQFWNDVQKHQTFGSQTIAVNNIVENLQKQENDEKLSIPDEVYKDMYDWYSGSSNMRTFLEDEKKFTRLRNQLRSYDSQVYSANIIVDKIQKGTIPLDLKNYDLMEGMEANELEDALYKIQHGNYDERYWAMLKFVDEKRLDAVVNGTFSDKNFYIGDPKDPKSREKAKLEFKKYLLNMLSRETDIQNRMVTHNNGFLALKRQMYGDQKLKEQQWTTIHNRASQEQQRLTQIAQGVVDPKARQEQLKFVYDRMGWSPIVDKNGNFLGGEVRGRIAVPQAAQGRKTPVPARSVRFEYDGKDVGLKDMQASIRAKYAKPGGGIDYNKMPVEDKYLLSLTENDVIPNANMVDAYQQYQYMDTDGKWKTVKVEDGAEKWLQAKSTGTMVYGGAIDVELPLTDPQGKQVHGYSVSYFNPDKNQMETATFASASEAQAKVKEDKRNKIIATKPMTYKQSVNLPRMRQTITGDDDINVAVQNEIWSGASKAHLTGFEQGGATFYPNGSIEEMNGGDDNLLDGE